MKYYIGSVNGSGIEANTFDDFVEYLRDMSEIAKKQGEEWFEINVETYLTGDEDNNVKKKRYYVYDIEWDADEKDLNHLPKTLTSEIEIENDKDYNDQDISKMISDDISNRIGFCHYGFKYKEIKEIKEIKIIKNN